MQLAPLETGFELISQPGYGVCLPSPLCPPNSSLIPPSFLPTEEASWLLLETQVSVHLATQLRNAFAPLGDSTPTRMHVW